MNHSDSDTCICFDFMLTVHACLNTLQQRLIIQNVLHVWLVYFIIYLQLQYKNRFAMLFGEMF